MAARGSLAAAASMGTDAGTVSGSVSSSTAAARQMLALNGSVFACRWPSAASRARSPSYPRPAGHGVSWVGGDCRGPACVLARLLAVVQREAVDGAEAVNGRTRTGRSGRRRWLSRALALPRVPVGSVVAGDFGDRGGGIVEPEDGSG